MISISRLLCDAIGPGDTLRYGNQEKAISAIKPPRPIVVWNCTRRCNLHCVHCYSSAGNQNTENTLTTREAKRFIQDLADFGVPVLLFSGGEPLLREDIFDLADFARSKGIKTVLSTNGTLITREIARKIKDVGFVEAGISLDGIGAQNDRFRGKEGAYEATLHGIRNCVGVGLRISLRLTITRATYTQIPSIFELVEKENIDRICFYHLAYVGRGINLSQEDLDHEDTREIVNLICDRTVDFYERGLRKEILTVDNHADGVFLYLKLKAQDPERAKKVFTLLKVNGGNNTGIRIGAVDEIGDVHPDQFWQHYSLGNVRNRSFGDIWLDISDPVMRGLKNRKGLLQGRCSKCHHLDICNGNLRVRAEAIYGDIWAEDPACYLTDTEIESG
jgi:radical SAM protein with 4Fe4S-binding SPASM domain